MRRAILGPSKPLALICLLASTQLAWAAPGTPGTPQAPKVLFLEDFDNTSVTQPTLGPNNGSGSDPTQATMVHTYLSAATDYLNNPLGQTYVASGVYQTDTNVPFWANAQWCNGIWMKDDQPYPTAPQLPAPYTSGVPDVWVWPGFDASTTPARYCSGNVWAPPEQSWKWLGVLANVLGQVTKSVTDPSDAAAKGNHAIAAFTNLPANRTAAPQTPFNVVLETVKPIPVPEGGRFVTFSVATAAMGCAGPGKDPRTFNPQFNFNLIDVQTNSTIELTPVAVDPCTQGTNFDGAQLPYPASGYGGNLSGVYAGQFYANASHRLAGSFVKLQVTSENSNGDSNDGAFDNLLLVDVTPQLDKSYSSGTLERAQTAKLTFTITNTCSEDGTSGTTCKLLEASGWSFSDTLPAGLIFASPANQQTTCGAPTAVALSGNNGLNVTAGSIGAGVASCTVSVDVALDPSVVIPSGGLDMTNSPVIAGGPSSGPGIVATSFLNPPASATIKALPSADLQAVPAATQTVKAGTPVTVVTQCINAGPDVALTPTCTVSGVPGDASGITQSCQPASGSVDLGMGDSITCTTTFTPQSTGTVKLDTVAYSTTQDPDSTNNDKPSYVNVVALAADMQATSASTQAVKVGTPVTVATRCVNAGPDVAAAATCVVTGIPGDATGIQQSCAPVSGSTSLTVGSEISCTTTFTPTKAETITLTTTAGSSTPDTAPSNNQAPSVVVAALIVADMQASGPTWVDTVVGTPVTVTTTCLNAGPDAATDASCVVTGGPADAVTVCTPTPPVASLARGSAISCTTTYTPQTGNRVTLVTTASSTTADSNVANNMAETVLGSGATAVPVDSRWMLILLGLALSVLAWRRSRR
ncbi:DUF7933 domain-containing protein [Diaphorobacter caeni]|uniref:DUF7933 domain-containing protein n=1 Tax=Diaphorobacter caeni TaxID=2784387 RepID=UPI00188FB270|nr:hypothetical protein [Diaphorobacter caeni]MBF5003152.1 hypothetical protein [Diaphorobacter caeni]